MLVPDDARLLNLSAVFVFRCRGDRTQDSEGERPLSVPFLTRHIQTLKKKVRRFEDQFEQEMNYKVDPGGGAVRLTAQR